MCPPSPCSSMRGTNVWIPLTTPPSRTPRPQSQSSYRATVTGPRMPMPALLHSTCTLPKTRSASSAARANPSRSVTSSSIAWTRLTGERLHGPVDVVAPEVGDDDVHAGADERLRHPEPDPARAAGDERRPALDLLHQSPGQDASARAFAARRPSSTASRSSGTGSSGNAASVSSKISRSSSRWSGCVKT